MSSSKEPQMRNSASSGRALLGPHTMADGGGETRNECCRRHARVKSLKYAAVLFFALHLTAPAPGRAAAQDNPAASEAGTAAPAGMLPVRVELGGYYSWADHGYGQWRGLDASLWYRGNRRIVPGFFVDSQTRPSGTQRNYSFISYLNWTPSFYTVQGVSGAPQHSDETIFFPKIRADLKGFWKLTPAKNFVVGTGFTYFDLGSPGHGQIYNVGALYYHKKLVMEGNLFINRSQPGDLWGGSGGLSLQYGAEGDYWLGVSASGGQELYRIEGLTPFDVHLKGYTIEVSYRRWMSRHVGFYLSAFMQEKLDAYRRAGGSARLFFEF